MCTYSMSILYNHSYKLSISKDDFILKDFILLLLLVMIMTENTKLIGKRIRELREEQQLSREKLSEKANISNQFLADIETGKKGMTVETFIKICVALSVSPNDLIFGFKDTNKDTEEILSMLNISDEKTVSAIKDIIRVVIGLK